MKAVLQRVENADVKVDGITVGEVGKGFLVLLGVVKEDEEKHADILAKKIAGLRVFKDANDKMNLSVLDIGGGALVVSQFTLCADCRKGRRPSFERSADPETANRLYEYFTEKLKDAGIKHVQTGRFGARMKVSLLNDGPVTIILDTDEVR